MAVENKPVDHNIVIIGGGLGGLALAVGLTKQGVDYHLYEQAPAFAEIGAGIACSPNAVRAIGMLSEDLLDAYKKHATFNLDPEHPDTWFHFRYGMDSRNGNDKKAGDLIFSLKDKHYNQTWTGTKTRSCIHRARFLDELVALVPEGVASFGKIVVKMEEDPESHIVTVSFADGSSVTANAVVAADGVKSRTREYVCGKPLPPVYRGEYAYRALVPMAEARKVLGGKLTLDGQMWCGYGAYVVCYAVDNNESLNMVCIPHKIGTTWEHKAWVVPSSTEAFLQDFKGWHSGLLELMCKYGKMEQWGLHNVIHDETYTRGRIVLLGDSAHASKPHQGAGGGMAMEDAYILSNLLGRFRDPKDLENVFLGYDSVRRPRTQRLIKSSDDAGMQNSFLKEGFEDDITKLIPDITKSHEWIWHEDLEEELQKANDWVLKSRTSV